MDAINLETIFDAIAEPVFLLDSKRRILTISATARQLFGDLKGSDFALAIRNPDALEAVGAVLAARPGNHPNQGEMRKQVVINLLAPLRTTYRLTAVRLSAKSDIDAAVVVSLNDISHIIEAEQMRSDFVANVSHELRSPLTTVSGFIETLQTTAKDDPEARERYLAIMATESERMKRIIADLLSLAKVEENERVRPETPVDVNGLVARTVASIAPRLEGEGKRIDVTLPSSPTMVPADEDQLMQVIINLIENAAKYSDPDSTISIDVQDKVRAAGFNNPVTAISVTDRGEGIEAEHLVRLTERFYRVDKGRSRRMGGTGLGLAIVKHIISRHRGRLAVSSKVGEGSTFSVYLPRQI